MSYATTAEDAERAKAKLEQEEKDLADAMAAILPGLIAVEQGPDFDNVTDPDAHLYCYACGAKLEE